MNRYHRHDADDDYRHHHHRKYYRCCCCCHNICYHKHHRYCHHYYHDLRVLQIGVAMGFLIPTEIVHNDDDLSIVGYNLRIMLYSTAVVSTLFFVIVVLGMWLCYARICSIVRVFRSPVVLVCHRFNSDRPRSVY